MSRPPPAPPPPPGLGLSKEARRRENRNFLLLMVCVLVLLGLIVCGVARVEARRPVCLEARGDDVWVRQGRDLIPTTRWTCLRWEARP